MSKKSCDDETTNFQSVMIDFLFCRNVSGLQINLKGWVGNSKYYEINIKKQMNMKQYQTQISDAVRTTAGAAVLPPRGSVFAEDEYR